MWLVGHEPKRICSDSRFPSFVQGSKVVPPPVTVAPFKRPPGPKIFFVQTPMKRIPITTRHGFPVQPPLSVVFFFSFFTVRLLFTINLPSLKWYFHFQDKSKNFVGKEFLIVLGGRTRCFTLRFSTVEPLLPRHVYKRIVGLTTRFLPLTNGRRSCRGLYRPLSARRSTYFPKTHDPRPR